MPSELRSEMSRINGAKSRGPKIPNYLANSTLNAVKLGITARTLALTNESTDHLLEIIANQMEIDIVCDIVAARWRLRRIWRHQTAMLDVEMDTDTGIRKTISVA